MITSTPGFLEQQSVVLFADICDSTRLYESLGDAAALDAINRCLRLLEWVAQEHRGRVVKVLGDGIMAVFPDPLSGILAACDMQSSVSALPPSGSARLALRVACNQGAILAHAGDQDVYGDTVNVAARLMDFARPGQIIATEATIALLPALQRPPLRRIDSVQLKGKARPVPVVEILWESDHDSTMIASRSLGIGPSFERLILSWGDKILNVEEGCALVTIGRDALSSLPVAVPAASRQHGRIESRGDHFVYVDQSTNGTYVTVRGEPELRLMHQDWIVRGSGWISLGQRYSKAPELAIAFECQQVE